MDQIKEATATSLRQVLLLDNPDYAAKLLGQELDMVDRKIIMTLPAQLEEPILSYFFFFISVILENG